MKYSQQNPHKGPRVNLRSMPKTFDKSEYIISSDEIRKHVICPITKMYCGFNIKYTFSYVALFSVIYIIHTDVAMWPHDSTYLNLDFNA